MKPRLRTKEPPPPPAARRRRPLWIGVGTLAALGIAAAAMAIFRLRPAGHSVQHGPGFNVILISLDTTRADHLGCYGQTGIRTPAIDRLATEGALFTQCGTVAPLTLPAHSSMMTGTYPFVHGARNNGQFYLHPDNETLAETLKQAGYATGAEVAAFVLNREFGLNQGFDTYEDVRAAAEAEETLQIQTEESQRIGEEVANSAIGWLRTRAAQKPFFLFIHFFDAHQPYRPPKRFAGQYSTDLYKGEIAYADEQVGRILAELKNLGLEHKTLVILTADHGEGRGEHGEQTHGHLVYDTTMHVPLILRCPERIPPGVRIADQVRLIDIAPTVLDFLELKPLPHAQGASMLSLIEKPGQGAERPIYGESLATLYDYGYAPLRMLRADGWKYIHAPQPELYDLRADAREQNNLAAQQPQRVAQMRDRLRGLIQDAPPAVARGQSGFTADPATLAAIQSLSYVGGSAAAAAGKTELELFEPAGPNPRDHITEIDLTSQAIGLMMTGQNAAAETMFRNLFARADARQEGLAQAHKYFGTLLSKMGKYAESIDHFRSALKNMPNDGQLLTDIGEALFKTGRTTEAIQTYEAALQAQPVFARTYHSYGAALATAGRVEEGVAQLRHAVELEPHFATAHAALARIYARTRRPAEAITGYNRALEIQPGQVRWRRELAELLNQQRRPQEALQQLEPVLRANPKDAAALAAQAQAYELLSRPEEAIQAYAEALRQQPNVPQWWEAEAALLLQRQRYKDAVDALRAARRFHPNQDALAIRLAWLLATCPDERCRNGAEAVQLAQKVRDAAPASDATVLDALAAALAETGRFEEAAQIAGEALRCAATAGQNDLAAQIETRQALYRTQKPYRLTP